MDHDRNHCSPTYQQELANMRLVSRTLNSRIKPVQESVLFLPVATLATGRLRYNDDLERRMGEVIGDEDLRDHVREIHVMLYGFGDEAETCMADRKDSMDDINDNQIIFVGERKYIDWAAERDWFKKLPGTFLQFVERLPALRTIRYISRILNDRTQQPVYHFGIELFWKKIHASIVRSSRYDLLDVRFRGAYDKRFIHVTSSWKSRKYDENRRRPLRLTQEFITWGVDNRDMDDRDTVIGMHFFTGLLRNVNELGNTPRGTVDFQDPSGQGHFPEKVTLSIENYNLWPAVLEEHFFFFGEQTTEVSLRGVSLNDVAWGPLLCWFLVGVREEDKNLFAFLNFDVNSSVPVRNDDKDRHHQPRTGKTEFLLMKDCSYSNYFPVETGVLPGPDSPRRLSVPPQTGQTPQGDHIEEQLQLYQSLADKCISWEGREAYADLDRRYIAVLFARVQKNRVRKGLPLLDLKQMYGLEEWST